MIRGSNITPRQSIPNRRKYMVRIAGPHVLYLTVQDDPNTEEVFLRVKSPDVTTESGLSGTFSTGRTGKASSRTGCLKNNR